MPSERSEEYQAAMRIAIYLSQNFYPTQSWVPEPSLLAVLTQIDSMVAGLPRPEPAQSLAVPELQGQIADTAPSTASMKPEDYYQAEDYLKQKYESKKEAG